MNICFRHSLQDLKKTRGARSYVKGYCTYYPLVICYIAMERSTMFFMGQPIVFLTMFNQFSTAMSQNTIEGILRGLVWKVLYPTNSQFHWLSSTLDRQPLYSRHSVQTHWSSCNLFVKMCECGRSGKTELDVAWTREIHTGPMGIQRTTL